MGILKQWWKSLWSGSVPQTRDLALPTEWVQVSPNVEVEVPAGAVPAEVRRDHYINDEVENIDWYRLESRPTLDESRDSFAELRAHAEELLKRLQ